MISNFKAQNYTGDFEVVEGNYTITANAGDAGTAYSGDLDQEGYILPTYYGKQTSTGDPVDIAMIAAGSFSITKSNANYTVSDFFFC